MSSSSSLLIFVLLVASMVHSKDGVTYYVLPTEPLKACTSNFSCPLGEVCQTLDNYARHSNHLLYHNVSNTLTFNFTCGLHKYSEHIRLQNFSTIVMQGMSLPENVVVQMPVNFSQQFNIIFSNMSDVIIKNINFKYPLVKVEKVGIFRIESSQLYGRESEIYWGGVSSNITIVDAQVEVV